MSARDQLVALYQEWSRLTVEEGGAIAAGAWLQVDEYQSSKQKLQAPIIEVSQRLEEEWRISQGQRMQDEPFFRQMVEELLQLETRNSELIAGHRREAEEQARNLNKATRSLQQIQRLYSGPRDPSWNSYS